MLTCVRLVDLRKDLGPLHAQRVLEPRAKAKATWRSWTLIPDVLLRISCPKRPLGRLVFWRQATSARTLDRGPLPHQLHHLHQHQAKDCEIHIVSYCYISLVARYPSLFSPTLNASSRKAALRMLDSGFLQSLTQKSPGAPAILECLPKNVSHATQIALRALFPGPVRKKKHGRGLRAIHISHWPQLSPKTGGEKKKKDKKRKEGKENGAPGRFPVV